jgi:hypothetical protein
MAPEAEIAVSGNHDVRFDQSRLLFGTVHPLTRSPLVMFEVISSPSAIRVEYRNGKRFRRTSFKTANYVTPASPSRVEEHLPTSIPANDSASEDITYESSIPFDAEKGVIIYYGVTVLDWKQQLAREVEHSVLALIRLEPDKTVIRKAAIGVARLAIAELASPADRMVRTEAGIKLDHALRLQIKQGEMGRELKSLLWWFDAIGGHIHLDSEQDVDTSTEYHAESLMLVVQRTLEEVLA